MPIDRLPEPKSTCIYNRIPFEFQHELTAANVFLKLPDGFSSLERMVLQTTGNLQRLLSAYHNVPSRVVILKNEIIPHQQNEENNIVPSDNKLSPVPNSLSSKLTYPSSLKQQRKKEQVSDVETKNVRVSKVNLHQDIEQEAELDIRFERKVAVYFGDKLAYEADSLVSVKDYKTLGLLSKHEFGLGQIFSYSRHTPKFALLAIGRHGTKPGQSFWRDYTLNAPGVVDCYIRETFVDGLFDDSFNDHNNSLDTDNINSEAIQGTVWYYSDYYQQ
ncbi:hypothetical protein INT45_011816 [Circinella minor]|uniref:Uncharacterized protein n=1 Tax=Circinella minor TaxID=1195481 RepID=A0A8H7SBS6_9FUNG|nr:hypothetical protein INT45_011816 [Circinella minor]